MINSINFLYTATEALAAPENLSDSIIIFFMILCRKTPVYLPIRFICLFYTGLCVIVPVFSLNIQILIEYYLLHGKEDDEEDGQEEEDGKEGEEGRHGYCEPANFRISF